jgi:uncharacterized NAD(P)/FAD-binding protein YdhS
MLDSIEQVFGDQTNISLILYDPTDEPWAGRAFQADGDWILANTPFRIMSMRHGDKSHAQRWLVRNGRLAPHHDTAAILPRPLYGEYISRHANDLVQGMRERGWRVEFVRERATSLEPNGATGYTVGTSMGRRDEHDYVILCASGSVLSDPFCLAGFDGYIQNPYPTRERLREIPTDAAVGILGSGLTAVDIAVSLHARGHNGPVRMYSRSGVLPLVRRPGPDWTARHLTVDRILAMSTPTNGLSFADLERLFDQEVKAWGGEAKGLFPPLPLEDPKRWLRWQLEHPHDREDLGTFIFQQAIADIWGDTWHALNSHETQRILGSSMPRDIVSRCCPVPRVNGEKLLDMLDSGQASCTKGVKSVVPVRGGFEVQLSSTRERVDFMVNAVTPASRGIHPGARELVDSAVGDGLAQLHRQGGLEMAGESSAVLGPHGQGGLYALGELTKGAFSFIFGVPILVRRSFDIAAAISQDAGRKRNNSITVTTPAPVPATEPIGVG